MSSGLPTWGGPRSRPRTASRRVGRLSSALGRWLRGTLAAALLSVVAAGCAFWPAEENLGLTDEVYNLPARMRRPDEEPGRWQASGYNGLDERTRAIERSLGVR